MNPRSAIQKGKELEDFVVSRLRATGLDNRAYRQKGSGNGLHKGDVWNDLNLCFEAKNTAKPNLGPTLRQVRRESLGTQEPVVVWHMPHTPLEDSQVIISWQYFEALLVKSKQPASLAPDRDLRWKLERLKQAANAVISEIK